MGERRPLGLILVSAYNERNTQKTTSFIVAEFENGGYEILPFSVGKI